MVEQKDRRALADCTEAEGQLTDSTTAVGESATDDDGSPGSTPLPCQHSTPAASRKDLPQRPRAGEPHRDAAPGAAAGPTGGATAKASGPGASRPLRSRLHVQAAAAQRYRELDDGDNGMFDWDLLGKSEVTAVDRKPEPQRRETLVDDAMEGLASLASNAAVVASAMATAVSDAAAAALGAGEDEQAVGDGTSPEEEAVPQTHSGATPRRIAALVNGSEGDLRPIIALSKILQEEKGHQVRVLTNVNLVHICIKHGIDAVPVFANTQAVIQACGGMRGRGADSAVDPARLAKKWLKEHSGEYIPVHDALEHFAPDAMLVGTLVMGVCMRYEMLRHVPAMQVLMNRSALENSDKMLVEREPPRPSFYPSSTVIDPRPMPSKRIMRTSAWVLQDEPQPQDLTPGGSLYELNEFLDRGQPPVAVGWGSMMAAGLPPAEMLELGLRALLKMGRRGVVLGGWAELDRVAAVAADGRLPSRLSDGGKLAAFAAEHICFVPWAPHSWLFPRCCCVIHHGGVGTTHAALRACRPQVITPICADQFYNAEVVLNLHVGIGFTKALPEISSSELAHAVGAALESGTTVAAQITGRKICREEGQGASRAAEMVDGYVRGMIRLSKGEQWVKSVAKTARS